MDYGTLDQSDVANTAAQTFKNSFSNTTDAVQPCAGRTQLITERKKKTEKKPKKQLSIAYSAN